MFFYIIFILAVTKNKANTIVSEPLEGINNDSNVKEVYTYSNNYFYFYLKLYIVTKQCFLIISGFKKIVYTNLSVINNV